MSMCVYTRMYVHVWHVHVCTCMAVHVCTVYVHVACVHVCACVCGCMCACVHVQDVHTCRHTTVFFATTCYPKHFITQPTTPRGAQIYLIAQNH